DKLIGLYWKTCKACTIPKFKKLISLIRCVRSDAHKKLVEAGFRKWSRALCPTTRYNYMTSNNAELVNALTKDMRKLPITTLMEWFRDLLQKWYYERRAKHQGTYPGIIYPVQDVSSWHTLDDFPLVLPPILGKDLPGRPKKNDRIPSQGEKLKNNNYERYGSMGHNRTACNVPMPKKQTTSSKRIKSTHDPSENIDPEPHQDHQHPNQDYHVQMMYEPQPETNNIDAMYQPQQEFQEPYSSDLNLNYLL
nr:transposase, MuDR, MULE transposase domain protein [Tanacetum cinerariifolium]